jgi:cytochrome oxidase Cu insertion factor (SCO1/SenC/PrrC family)
MLRDESATSTGLKSMLKMYKVPVGLTDKEAEEIKSYFMTASKPGLFKRWFGRKQDAADGYLNDHSRAMYLMAPDNKFVAFYTLNLSEDELRDQIIEDISYDIG